jgi:hypothetical protein
MLDRWLERMTCPSPTEHAKAQMRDLAASIRRTLKEMDKHPQERGDILHRQKVRTTEILERGTKPPPERCPVCGKPLPAPAGNPWTNHGSVGIIWAFLLAVLVLGLLPVTGLWVFLMLPVGWLASQTFVWPIPVPLLLLVIGSLVF